MAKELPKKKAAPKPKPKPKPPAADAPIESMTKKELTAELKALGVDVPFIANKKKIIGMLKEERAKNA